MEQATAKVTEAFADVQKAYTKAVDQQQLEASRSSLIMFLELFSDKLLHRRHALVFQSRCLLASCCLALDRWSEAAVQLRAALGCALASLHRHRYETATLCYRLGEALLNSLPQRPPHCREQIRQDSAAAFRQSATIYKVICGDSHPTTMDARARTRAALVVPPLLAQQQRAGRVAQLTRQSDSPTINAPRCIEVQPSACDYVCWETQPPR